MKKKACFNKIAAQHYPRTGDGAFRLYPFLSAKTFKDLRFKGWFERE